MKCEICDGSLVPEEEHRRPRLVWVHGVEGRDDCGQVFLCEVCETVHSRDGELHRTRCLRCRAFRRRSVRGLRLRRVA
jgi:hypothetical protein